MGLWRNYERQLDAAVDNVWSEPVWLYPYMVDPISSQPTADTTRTAIATFGVMMRHGAAVTGEGAIMGGQSSLQQVTSDVWLSISQANLPNTIADWHPGDRVYFPDRDANNEAAWYEVNWVAPSATARWNIHLTVLEPGA